MLLTFSLPQPTVHLIDSVVLTVQAQNNGPSALRVSRELAECHFLLDGEEADFFMTSWGNPPYDAVAPGAAITFRTTHALNFGSVFKGRAQVERFTFQIRGKLLIDGQHEPFESPPFDIAVDLSGVQVLLAPGGTPSRYIVEGQRVIYVSDNSRAYEERTKVLKVNRASVRVVSTAYLLDATSVFRSGRLQKGVSPVGFQILNRVFAKNDSIVLTSYGDAKVADPASFEVLDAGDNSPFTKADGTGYGGGYGRDLQFVYFFDESTSPHHAVRVKSCKNPATFVSLPAAHGRDDRNVYSEGNRIKGADPRSWRPLNRLYSRDDKAIYYGTNPLEGADVESFELVDPPVPGMDSPQARDKLRRYEFGRAVP